MEQGRIVFWQQNSSPHQSSWIRALADMLPPGRVVAVFEEELPPQRVALGWNSPESGPNYGQTKVFIRPGVEVLESLIQPQDEPATHIFSGSVHVPSINQTLELCLKTGERIGILSEARDHRGLHGALRLAHSFFHERRHRNHISFVLAIGCHAGAWYRKCGFRPERLFPFCYAVENAGPVTNCRTDSTQVVLTFVGQLIPRKGLDLLLRALATVRSSDWALRIIGEGSERYALEKLASDLNLLRKTTFTGALDNGAVRNELANADLFVLPSRWDGWGAVVNEALMSGTPVICSSYCGAADLISNGMNGEIFEYGSSGSLIAALERGIAKGPLSASSRTDITEWSKCIEGATVASYFLQILQFLDRENGQRPKPPWAI